MGVQTTAFRPLASMGWGGRAGGAWRGLVVPGPIVDAQVGTRIARSPGGFSNSALDGVSRDAAGVALGNCRVDLCQGNLIKQSTVSDGAGNFTFLNPGSGPFFIAAYKPGAPDVAGLTANTLHATLV